MCEEVVSVLGGGEMMYIYPFSEVISGEGVICATWEGVEGSLPTSSHSSFLPPSISPDPTDDPVTS